MNLSFRYSILFLVVLLPLLSLAQKPRESFPFEIQADEEEAWIVQNNMRVSETSNMPLSLYDLNIPVPEADPETMGKAVLARLLVPLGWQPGHLNRLQLRTHRNGQAGTTVRFLQMMDAVPVYNSEVTVNLDLEHTGRLVFNGWKYGLPVLNTTPSLSRETARELAHDHIRVQGRIQFDETKLWVYPHGTPRLAWQVRVEPESPLGSWEVMVDAHTGEIFKATDQATYYHEKDKIDPETGTEECEEPGFPTPIYVLAPPPVNGTGLVFDTDPLTTATTTYGGNYADNGDASNAQLVAEQQNVTLLDITFSGGQHRLIGPYAEIQDFENPLRGLFTQASSVFNYDRQANNFEAVNVYYHIDKSMRYINVTLGCNIMPYQYTTGVRFDPSGLNGADNSHYLGGSGRLAFGDGGVDDAEDADVILHELGHGIHDWATVGGLSQVNGLSEGSGDYWANSYKRSLGYWTTANQQYYWVFGWDGHNPFWGGRVTNYGASYPGGLTGFIHTDGQIWSTCCLLIWEQIGRQKMDKAFLEGLSLTNGSSSQQDAAIAVRTAAINMNYTVAEVTTIHNIFAGCGYNMGTLPALPIELVQFEGTRSDLHQVDLEWVVESAIGFEGFEVERQVPGDSGFTLVGYVPIMTPGKKDFNFRDDTAPTGRIAYRLAQKDQDGGTQYSEVIVVEGLPVQDHGMVVFPNPTSGTLHILIEQPENTTGTAQLEVLDLNGRKVWTQATQVQGPTVLIDWPEATQLEPGMYLLKVTTAHSVYRGTFSKVK